MKKIYNLIAGDELRLACNATTVVTVEAYGEHGVSIVDAIAVRDEEIAVLRSRCAILEEKIEGGIRVDADTLIDRLVERLSR